MHSALEERIEATASTYSSMPAVSDSQPHYVRPFVSPQPRQPMKRLGKAPCHHPPTCTDPDRPAAAQPASKSKKCNKRRFKKIPRYPDAVFFPEGATTMPVELFLGVFDSTTTSSGRRSGGCCASWSRFTTWCSPRWARAPLPSRWR